MKTLSVWLDKLFRLDKRILLVFLYVTVVFADGGGLSEKLLKYVYAKYGQTAINRLAEWQNLIASGKNKADIEKVKLVNTFFNRIKFVDDIVHWGKTDYWATPVEFLITNGGDCEDFAIAKYFTLKEMGVPDEAMLITYTKSLTLNQSHMVLTYYPTRDGDPLVLDNLIKEIKPASARKDLVPIYSFNGKDLWLSKERGRGRRVGASDRISLWQNLNDRIAKEMNN